MVWTKGFTSINCERLSRSGHGVIFGALVLKSVSDSRTSICDLEVENIVRLLENCSHDNWDRYHDNDDYREFNAVANLISKDIYSYAVEQSSKDLFLDSDGYFYTGEKVHGITHAHAIFLLEQLGYHTAAKKAKVQLQKQIQLNRQSPPAGGKRPTKKMFNPNDPHIWGRGFKDMHQIKLAFSYIELRSNIDINELWGALSSI